MTALLLASLLAALAADQEVDSKVSAVTVYADRARVTRTVAVQVPPGRTELIFEGLPMQLIPDSLAAEGEGTAAATLTGIDIRPRRGTEDRDTRVAALREERQRLADEVAEHNDTVARVQGELAFLLALQPQAPDQLSEPTFLADDAPEQLAGLASQVGEDMGALLVEQRTHERAIRDLSKEISRIDREISQLSSAGGTDSQRVAVGLDAKRAGRVEVRLSYVTTGTAWTPRYDARFDPDSSTVRLDLSGEVVQRTGEDWEGVQLTLSTARPQQGTNPPQLEPFFLGQGYSAGHLGGAVAADRVTAFEFTSKRREDVASDGTKRRVFLTRMELEGETVHQVVARRQEAAWLTAEVTNTADFALLPGPMASYLGSAYVGDGRLQLVPPGEQMHLSFGVDDRVGVKRQRLQDMSEGTKPLGNKERRTWGWETTVKNQTGQEIRVLVHDQVPASRDATWEVETTPTPEVRVPADGVFSWQATIPSGREQAFSLEYQITWPEGDAPVLLD